MQRSEALKKAEQLITGERAKSYGDSYQTHENIYRCMIVLKCVRLTTTPKHEDSMVDIIGYAALAMEAFDGKSKD